MSSPFPLWFCARLLIVGVVLSAPVLFSTEAVRPPRQWPANPFTPLTPERIAALPPPERTEWQEYWDASEKLAATLPSRPAAETSALKPRSGPPLGGIHTKGLRLAEPAAWYATGEARLIADRVASGQTRTGAWAKGMDYTKKIDANSRSTGSFSSGTFDNDATIFELRFLARVISAAAGDTPSTAWHRAFERGVRYVFAAQYPNGGYPQVYPLIGGYHDGVTFNDDAMVHILELLRDISHRQKDYSFVSPAIHEEATTRLQRGIRCVLETQQKDSRGAPTGWCQQYDPLTLKPSAARNFEPIADASRESSSLVLFLMSLPNPSPEIVSAVEGAIAWFRATALRDLRIARAPADARGEAIASPGAPPIWARFYEPGTATPIFGDRDRMIHYSLREVSAERVAGYAWYTEAPAKALSTYDGWRKTIQRSRS